MAATPERDLRVHRLGDGQTLVFPYLWGSGFAVAPGQAPGVTGALSGRLQQLWATMWALCVAAYAASLQATVWHGLAPFAAALVCGGLPLYFVGESWALARRGARACDVAPLAWRLAAADFLAVVLRRQRLDIGTVCTALVLPLGLAAGLPSPYGTAAVACSQAAFWGRFAYGWSLRGRLTPAADAGPRGAGARLPAAGAVLAALVLLSGLMCAALAVGLVSSWQEEMAALADK